MSIRDWMPWRRPERRESAYTQNIVSALEASAAGGGGVATATAAVETAAGLWGRALALANVEPKNRRTAAITPSFLELAGRELGRRGELVCDIDVDAGGVRLFPAASSYVVIGGHDPATWIYTLTLFGPGRTVTVNRHRAGVLHLAYGPDRVAALARARAVAVGIVGRRHSVRRRKAVERRGARQFGIRLADP